MKKTRLLWQKKKQGWQRDRETKERHRGVVTKPQKNKIKEEDGSTQETNLLEEGIDAGKAAIPGVFEVFKGEATILGIGFLTFEGILGPDPLGVDEFGFPGLDVAE